MYVHNEYDDTHFKIQCYRQNSHRIQRFMLLPIFFLIDFVYQQSVSESIRDLENIYLKLYAIVSAPKSRIPLFNAIQIFGGIKRNFSTDVSWILKSTVTINYNVINII